MKPSWNYEKSGVPHLKGDSKYNARIRAWIQSTHRRGVLGSSTGFAALFDLSQVSAKKPLLVSSTDGVGTKLELARLRREHQTIGIDLVAMCVNDLITTGAQPLFFLDYFATGKFDPKTMQEVLKGIVKGCRESSMALVGGETAIMPGFYEVGASYKQSPQYDLAGFSVGVIDRKRLISGKSIRRGDSIIGIASSGFHSNGYSLLRKLFSKKELLGPIGKQLLAPTKIYVRSFLKLIGQVDVRGIANITGGGMIENIPRILPKGKSAQIYGKSWTRSKLFQLVQDFGNIHDFEMFRTFNMGIGMVVVVPKEEALKTVKILSKQHMKSWVIGTIVSGNQKVEVL